MTVQSTRQPSRIIGTFELLEAIATRLFSCVKTVATSQQTTLRQELGVSMPVEPVRPSIRHGVLEG